MFAMGKLSKTYEYETICKKHMMKFWASPREIWTILQEHYHVIKNVEYFLKVGLISVFFSQPFFSV